MNFGNYIYSEILDNQYLKFLYTKLLKLYFNTHTKLIREQELTKQEKIDLLRFADILSKSTEESKRDFHSNIAQSIVSMLNDIYVDDYVVRYVNGSVLSNVNNYLGLDKNFKEYFNRDFIEFFKECFKRESYAIPCNESQYFISSQKLAYERIKQNDFYSFSAPTSMGKTFLIRMFIKESIKNGEKQNFAIVVPSKALINEVSNSIIDDNEDNLIINKFKVIQSSSAITDDGDYNYVMVLTQERLLQLLLQKKNIKLSHVFIDEAHKISETDDRSPFLYKCIEILEKKHFGVKINFSCPNIPNPEIYLKAIKGVGNKAYNCFKYSPVNQLKSIIDIVDGNCFIYNDLEKTFLEVESDKSKFSNLINIIKSIGFGKSNIIFCNSKKEATKWAIEYMNLINDDLSTCEEIIDLVKNIKEEIHEDCYLTKTLLKGVAYHVAYLPSNIKEKIEKLYRNGTIKTIFCTSTLLEGVNFPADNLFIKLNHKDLWLKDKQRASFKNLIGRVGRVDFNLFGNVFCISENAINEYKNAISEDVSNQTLSLDKLTENRKRDIINTLIKGKTALEKRSSDTFESLGFARKVLNLLLKEIMDNNFGIVSEAFSKQLNEDVIKIIKEKFNNKQNKIPKDLLVTCDEMEKLDYAIKNLNLCFPEDFSYSSVVVFLETLFDIFNWNKYESGDDIGNKNRLKYYALLLIKWIFGKPINAIIDEAIEHAKQNGVYYKFEKPNLQKYIGSPEQINKIINDVLDEIDKILQFKIPNYFQKFSERYKELNQIENLSNDWYEYVEYGTNSPLQIKFQQIGLTREFANYIYKNRYFSKENGKIKVLIDKIKTNKFIDEIKRLKLNHPEYI